MEKGERTLKRLLVLISVLLAVILVVELVSLSLLNSLKNNSSLQGELATIYGSSSTYSSSTPTYTSSSTSSSYSSSSSSSSSITPTGTSVGTLTDVDGNPMEVTLQAAKAPAAATLSQVVCGTTWCASAPKCWPKDAPWPPRDMTGNCELCSTSLSARKITSANNGIILCLKNIPTCPLPSNNYCTKCGAVAWPPQIVKMSSCPYS